MLDLLHLGLLLLLQSSAHCGPVVSMLDFVKFASSVLVRQYSRLDLTLFVLGVSRLDSLMLLLDHIDLEFLMSLHSFAHLEFSALVLDFLRLGPMLSLQKCF